MNKLNFRNEDFFDFNKNRKTTYKNKEIYTPFYYSLVNAISWDIGLGFFSLSSFKQLAWPLARFLINGGKIRMYCNERLSETDYNLLLTKKSINDLSVYKDFSSIYKSLEGKNQDLFADCISYLINSKSLELKVLVNRENQYGISHQKNFIFTDGFENKVVIHGSPNLSETAFLFNNEDVDFSCSIWSEDKFSPTNVKIEERINDFESHYNNQDDDWKAIEINSPELQEKLKEIGFRKVNKTELENRLSNPNSNTLSCWNKKIRSEIEDQIKELNPLYRPNPSFPYDEPYKYQKEAYKKWKENNYKGIFAMATGTGKTLTAINCLIQDYSENRHKFIFVVPGKELVSQWSNELKNGNFGNIYKWYSGEDGTPKKQLIQELSSLLKKPTSKINLIITYDSFSKPDFLKIISNHLHIFTIVFDEVHEMGRPGIMNTLPNLEKTKLIGLSATPERQYDEDGKNEFISNIFNCNTGSYTYEFSIDKAIEKGFLVPYKYFIEFVELTNDEWEEYQELTSKMFTSDELGRQKINTTVAQNRHRIVDQATNKIFKTKKIVNQLLNQNNYKFTLIYCPEGSSDFFIGNFLGESEKLINLYLEELIKSFPEINFEVFVSGTPNRKGVLETFEDGNFLHQLLSMKVLDQGVDVPNIRNAILVASASIIRQHIQRRGRILRKADHLGKTYANLFDLIVIPPIEKLKFGVGKSLVLNEFRRFQEFWRCSKNKNETKQYFDNFLKELDISFDDLKNEITHYE